jgi:hypothetical protein
VHPLLLPVAHLPLACSVCVPVQPPYPVSCTAAYYAAQVKEDAVIANDYREQ